MQNPNGLYELSSKKVYKTIRQFKVINFRILEWHEIEIEKLKKINCEDIGR